MKNSVFSAQITQNESDWIMEKEFRRNGYPPIIIRALQSDVNADRWHELMQEYHSVNAELNLAKTELLKKYIPEYLLRGSFQKIINFSMNEIVVYEAMENE